MLEQLKALSKETLIYGATTVIGRFLNLILVPFYVNVLDPKMYGVSTSMYSYISFVGILYTLGLEAAYFRYASKGEGEQRSIEEEKRLFSGPFLFVLIFGGILSTALFLCATVLVVPVFHDPHADITQWIPALTSVLRMGAIILLLDSLNVIPFAALRIDRRAKWFGAVRLTGIVLTLVFNFILILGLHLGVEGVFYANVLGSAAMMAMLAPTIWRRFEFRISRPVMKKLLPFGLTNVPAYISAMMVQVIDRPIVQAYLGLAMLGIYQANYRMGVVMMVFVSLFEYAWRPFFLREARTNDARARLLFSRVFTYFMLIACVGFLFLSFLLPDLLTVRLPIIHHAIFQRRDYLVGLDIIPVVLAAYIFQGMYTNFIAGIYIKEHNKVLPGITGLGAAVNVLANIILIPLMGIMGAAIATLLAYVAMAGAIYRQSQKVYPVPYDWKRVGMLASIVLASYLLERIVTLGHIVSSHSLLALIRTLLFLGAVGTLFAVGFFSKGELAALRSMVSRRSATEAAIPDKLPREPIQGSEERREGE